MRRPVFATVLVLACCAQQPEAPVTDAATPGDEPITDSSTPGDEPVTDRAAAPTPVPTLEATAPSFIDGRPVLRLGGEVRKPVALRKDTSALEALRGRYWWSTCIVQAVVSRRGLIEHAELLRPDNAAAEAERVILEMFDDWLFEPATLDGEPVDVSYTLVIHHCPSIERGDKPRPNDPSPDG